MVIKNLRDDVHAGGELGIKRERSMIVNGRA